MSSKRDTSAASSEEVPYYLTSYSSRKRTQASTMDIKAFSGRSHEVNAPNELYDHKRLRLGSEGLLFFEFVKLYKLVKNGTAGLYTYASGKYVLEMTLTEERAKQVPDGHSDLLFRSSVVARLKKNDETLPPLREKTHFFLSPKDVQLSIPEQELHAYFEQTTEKAGSKNRGKGRSGGGGGGGGGGSGSDSRRSSSSSSSSSSGSSSGSYGNYIYSHSSAAMMMPSFAEMADAVAASASETTTPLSLALSIPNTSAELFDEEAFQFDEDDLKELKEFGF